jgi:hypothetical protein
MEEIFTILLAAHELFTSRVSIKCPIRGELHSDSMSMTKINNPATMLPEEKSIHEIKALSHCITAQLDLTLFFGDASLLYEIFHR